MIDLQRQVRRPYQPPAIGQVRVGNIRAAQSPEEGHASGEAIWLMLEAIPPLDPSGAEWWRLLAATFDAAGGSEWAWFAFVWWLRKSSKYDDKSARDAWLKCRIAAATGDGFATLYEMATQYGWSPPAWLHFNLSEDFAAAGDVSPAVGHQSETVPPEELPPSRGVAASVEVESTPEKTEGRRKPAAANTGEASSAEAMSKSRKKPVGSTRRRKRSVWV